MKIYLIRLVIVFLTACTAASAQNIKINSLNPAAVQTGATAFPLIVKGSNFPKNAKVQVNGTTLDTVQTSWNKLRATVPANLTATANGLPVKIVSGNRQSNSVNLTVSASPVGSYDWTALNQRLNGFVPSIVPGLTLMISRHGRVVHTQAFGNQTANTILSLASATKMPAMLAILTLVDAGALNLDAPISVYLAGQLEVPPNKANITMRMLMNHTSGLSGTSDASCLDDRQTTLKLCAQQILNLPLAYPPGTRFDYGGNGMQLAGYVAEVLAGQSWNQFFADKIKTPLGLVRFTFTNTTNPRIAGGAFSDVGDYTRILQTYLAGGVYQNTRIISNRVYFEMQTDQWRGLPVINNPGGSRLSGYSYGWWHSGADYLQSLPAPRTSGPELSDQGLFGCTPWIDFENNYTAILLVNSNVPTATVMWNEIRPLIIEQMRRND